MFTWKEIRKSLIAALWFMFLTFPIMVIKVNTIENTIVWRWNNLLIVGIGAFVLSFIWRRQLERRDKPGKKKELDPNNLPLHRKLLQQKKFYLPALGVVMVLVLLFPFLMSMYQTNIMITALMYVVLGLGLNIVVGLGGMLNLGYAAFYAAGAYTYALLNLHFGINFWVALPIGGAVAALLGIMIGFPVLRLRGDYLAIVTLAFGEIIRIVLENWNEFSYGPSGIANIPRPAFFVDLNIPQATIYLYFIMIAMVLFTIFVVRRLENSRIGRAWVAMREDEIACQAMGIDLTKTKLTAFALGATWAGFVGVIFASKTTFINPASFTVWESIIILSLVVLGGMGSIPGVIVGAFVLILLPEYLRAFSEYRMLVFGVLLVLMMVFRPGGIVRSVRKRYTFEKSQEITAD